MKIEKLKIFEIFRTKEKEKHCNLKRMSFLQQKICSFKEKTVREIFPGFQK